MAINPGDIAFVGVNATDPDQFAILALNAIAAGDSFYVTDGGITGASGAAAAYFGTPEKTNRELARLQPRTMA
jgi:hypothetical protein